MINLPEIPKLFDLKDEKLEQEVVTIYLPEILNILKDNDE